MAQSSRTDQPAEPSADPALIALDRLKRARERREPAFDLKAGMREAKERQRQALTVELLQLMNQVQTLHQLSEPRAAAAQAVFLAKRIASVAKALAALSDREGGGNASLEVRAAQAETEATRTQAALSREAQDVALAAEGASASQPPGQLSGQEADTPSPTQNPQLEAGEEERARQREQLQRYAAPKMKTTGYRQSQSVRELLERAADRIRDLAAILRRAQEAEWQADGRPDGRQAEDRREIAKSEADIRSAIRGIDFSIRLPLSGDAIGPVLTV